MKDDDDERVLELLVRPPRYLSRWARRDSVCRYVGRVVSPKPQFESRVDPSRIGIILEIGPSTWTAIVWEDGAIDRDWLASDLDYYAGPANQLAMHAVVDSNGDAEAVRSVLRHVRATGMLGARKDKR